MNPSSPPVIGRNIQKLRKEQKLTLDILSERSGVSKAMLSQIESEKVNPTVATVWKIAQGLSVDINTLFKASAEPVRNFLLTRKDTITTLETDEEGVHIKVLSPISMAEDLEMYLVTISPGGSLFSNPHYSRTEEFLTLLEGKVMVRAGENRAELSSGDFIRYHCDVEHEIVNSGRNLAVIHMVVRFNKKAPLH